MMVLVKVLDEQHEDDLTESVNQFLAVLQDKEILSIQFSTSHFLSEPEQIFSFSAMIVYCIKDNEEGKLEIGGQ